MLTKDQILTKYIETINDIDDYLEYVYMHDTKEEMRSKIMSMIDKMFFDSVVEK